VRPDPIAGAIEPSSLDSGLTDLAARGEMWAVVGVPTEVSLELVRSEIAKNRGLAKVRSGALCFGILRSADGLTDWWTIFLVPGGATLERGVAPIDFEGSVVVLYADESAIAEITRGGPATGVEIEGDTDLLAAIAPCFAAGNSLLDLRALK